MGSPENLSKRERQKQRRNAKLQQQRAADAKARRNRLMTFALLGVILAGLVGLAVQRNIAARQAEEDERLAAQAKLDDLGCTPAEKQEDLGSEHLQGETLAPNPPDVTYPDRPGTSGPHFANWIKTGVYDQLIDERALVHNLEHGYVVGYYDEDAPKEQVAEFTEDAEAHIAGDYPKLIVSPWDGKLPGDANFAYVGWNIRQTCAEYDSQVLNVFLKGNHSSAGVAPEKALPPHLEEGNGTIDPGTEPFLLPPLGDQAVPGGGMSEPAAPETAPSEDSS